MTNKTEPEGITSKIKWKIYARLVCCISSLEGTSYKKNKDTATSFYFCFTSAFTSADINLTF